MSRAVVAVLLLVGVAAAWIWGLSPLLAPWPPPAPRPPAVRPPAVVPAVHLPKLAARAASDATPPEGRRNPFMVGEAPTPPSARVPAPTAAAPRIAPPAPAAATWPRLDLIGVAEVREGAGVVRTAVIAGPRGIEHARPGDLLEQVYRLERVTAAGVDLRLLPEDRVVHLALRP